jgi:hypothetical protein
VPGLGIGRPVPAMLACAPGGGMAKIVNLQPAAAPEAAAVPHKTRVPATRPAAVSSTLVSPSSRVGRFPARELQLMQVTDFGERMPSA